MLTSTIILVLAIMGCFMSAGFIVLYMAIRGRLTLVEARCRRCDYQIDREIEPGALCTECGFELVSPNAIRFDRKVRSVRMFVIGGVLLLLIPVTPLVFAATQWLSDLGDSTTVNQADSADAPTWLKPVSETPEIPEHQSFDVRGIENSELLQAIRIRPFDAGLWTALGFRGDEEGFSTEELEQILDLVILRLDIVDQNPLAPIPHGPMNSWVFDSAFEAFLTRMDPNDERNLERMSTLMAFAMDIPSQLLMMTGKSIQVELDEPLLPGSVEMETENLSYTLDGKIHEYDESMDYGGFFPITIPAIAMDGIDVPHELTFKADVSLTANAITWQIPINKTIAVDVIAPGESPLTYIEHKTLPDHYRRMCEGTNAIAWKSQSTDDPKTFLCIRFPFIPNGHNAGGHYLTTHLQTDENQNTPRLRRGSENTQAAEFTNTTHKETGSNEQLFIMDQDFNDSTINLTLDPMLPAEPSRFLQASGVFGSRLVLEDLPVTWLDDVSDSSTIYRPKVRIESIGSITDGPLFGPGPINDGDPEAMSDWLAPRLVIHEDQDGKQVVVLHYGGGTPLPQPASLFFLSRNPDGPVLSGRVGLSTESTNQIGDGAGQRGRVQIKSAGEPLEPGDVITMEFKGFPLCLRRDQRDIDPSFGGRMMIDVPVHQGVKDDATGVMMPAREDASP